VKGHQKRVIRLPAFFLPSITSAIYIKSPFLTIDNKNSIQAKVLVTVAPLSENTVFSTPSCFYMYQVKEFAVDAPPEGGIPHLFKPLHLNRQNIS
jgi:hypothetical protein